MKCVAVICVAAVLVVAGCRPGPKPAEPFARNRLGVMAASVESALTAQVRARDHLEESLAEVGEERALGMEPAAAYDLARQFVLQAEARERTVCARIKQAGIRGEDAVDEWRRELAFYDDKALKKDAEASLSETKRRLRGAVGALREAAETLEPVRQVLSDRMLFLKHHRDHPGVPAMRPSGEGQGKAAAAREAMNAKTAAAETAVEELVARVRGREPAHPPASSYWERQQESAQPPTLAPIREGEPERR